MKCLFSVCLPSHLSLFLSGCKQLHYNNTLDNISKYFNICIKCCEIMFQRLDMLFCDGYVSIGAINSVLSGGCFLLLPGMSKVL